MIAGLVVSFTALAAVRRWLPQRPQLTRAATFVAPLPVLAFLALSPNTVLRREESTRASRFPRGPGARGKRGVMA